MRSLRTPAHFEFARRLFRDNICIYFTTHRCCALSIYCTPCTRENMFVALITLTSRIIPSAGSTAHFSYPHYRHGDNVLFQIIITTLVRLRSLSLFPHHSLTEKPRFEYQKWKSRFGSYGGVWWEQRAVTSRPASHDTTRTDTNVIGSQSGRGLSTRY